jgi:hypothetical protein
MRASAGQSTLDASTSDIPGFLDCRGVFYQLCILLQASTDAGSLHHFQLLQRVSLRQNASVFVLSQQLQRHEVLVVLGVLVWLSMEPTRLELSSGAQVDIPFARHTTGTAARLAPRSLPHDRVQIGGHLSSLPSLLKLPTSSLTLPVHKMGVEATAGVSCTPGADAESRHGAHMMGLHGGSAAGGTTSQMATTPQIASWVCHVLQMRTKSPTMMAAVTTVRGPTTVSQRCSTFDQRRAARGLANAQKFLFLEGIRLEFWSNASTAWMSEGRRKRTVAHMASRSSRQQALEIGGH